MKITHCLFFFRCDEMIENIKIKKKKGNIMNKDLAALNEEIDLLLQKPPTMEKFQRLGILFVCKNSIEKILKTDKTTIAEIIDDKINQIGARATLAKIEPILSKHIKDLEMIAPTISGEFMKKIKEI